MQEQNVKEARLAELLAHLRLTGMYEFTPTTFSFCGSSCGTMSSINRTELASTYIHQRRVDDHIPIVRDGANGFVILDKDYSVILEWNK